MSYRIGLFIAVAWSGIAGSPAVSRSAAQDPQRAADAVFGQADTASARQDAALDKRIRDIERAIEGIESRLGRSIKQPSLTHNFERRMQEIEKRMESIEREVKRMDDRLKKLESRR